MSGLADLGSNDDQVILCPHDDYLVCLVQNIQARKLLPILFQRFDKINRKRIASKQFQGFPFWL